MQAYPSFNVLEALVDAVVVSDIDGVIIWVNSKTLKLFEYSDLSEVVGQDVKIFCHPQIADKHGAYVKRYASVGSGNHMASTGIDSFGKTKEGEIIPVHVTITEYAEEGRRLLLGCFRDLRREREIEKQFLDLRKKEAGLEAASAASKEMLRYVDHELRQPLNGITNTLDLLADELSGGAQLNIEACRDLVRLAKRSSTDLLTIITNFVDIRKIESGLIQLNLKSSTLPEIIEAARSSLLTTSLAEKSDYVTLEVHEGKGFTNDVNYDLDASRVIQILSNVLDNALKFTKAGVVRLTVSATSRGAFDVVLFEVTDTGSGISPEVVRNIFPVTEEQPGVFIGTTPHINSNVMASAHDRQELIQSLKTEFSAGTQGDRRAFEGTGLGLRLSLLLTMMMRGALGCRVPQPPSLRADGSGSGSTFWLEVPLKRTPSRSPFVGRHHAIGKVPRTTSSYLAVESRLSVEVGDSSSDEEEDSDGDAAMTTPAAPRKRTKLHFLVVDDVKINRSVLRTILHKLGHTTDEAVDGMQAVTMARAAQYDLVFMDVRMPVLGGREATLQIRSSDVSALRTIPIVAITGDVCQEDVKRSLDAGMNEVLGKPITREAVEQIIDRMLQ